MPGKGAGPKEEEWCRWCLLMLELWLWFDVRSGFWVGICGGFCCESQSPSATGLRIERVPGGEEGLIVLLVEEAELEWE